MTLAVLACIFGPGSLIAIVTWWRQPRLWWACLGILATAAGALLYLPVRFAFYAPSELDDVFDRLGILVEFVEFCGLAIVVHLGSLVAISLMTDEKAIEREKTAESE